MIDTRSKEATWIDSHDFTQRAPHLAETETQEIAARDGPSIPVRLTRPVGVDKTGWTQVIGDPERPKDIEEMRRYSPINLVDRITKPVLLAHGVNDQVVDRTDSERFERRLKELGKAREAYYCEKEGHGFDRWQTHVKFCRKVEEFLARHLGGRSGGFDYVEIGANHLYP